MERDAFLLSSMEVNGMEVRNRLVRSATYEGMATKEGEITEQLIKLYTRLAEGGVGLIITGLSYVQENGRAVPFGIGVHSDDLVPGLKRLVDAVHDSGTKIALQLAHSGRQTVPSLIGGQTPLAPSAIEADPFLNVEPREMTVKEIGSTIEAFGEAARRAKEAGFDAVQLHAAHGFLLSQFISPHTNRRTDEWGGNPENRMRIVIKVYERVREAIGHDYPVLVKLNVEEGLENGITLKEASGIAKRLAQIGIDAIEISGGTLVDTIFVMCRGDIPIDILTRDKDPATKEQMAEALYSIRDQVKFEEAYWLEHAGKIKEIIGDVPLMLVGGMKYPQTMEKILGENKADFISLSRALIREPDLPKQIAEGRKDPVKCSFCNRCLGEVGVWGKELRCYNLG